MKKKNRKNRNEIEILEQYLGAPRAKGAKGPPYVRTRTLEEYANSRDELNAEILELCKKIKCVTDIELEAYLKYQFEYALAAHIDDIPDEEFEPFCFAMNLSRLGYLIESMTKSCEEAPKEFLRLIDEVNKDFKSSEKKMELLAKTPSAAVDHYVGVRKSTLS